MWTEVAKNPMCHMYQMSYAKYQDIMPDAKSAALKFAECLSRLRPHWQAFLLSIGHQSFLLKSGEVKCSLENLLLLAVSHTK